MLLANAPKELVPACTLEDVERKNQMVQLFYKEPKRANMIPKQTASPGLVHED